MPVRPVAFPGIFASRCLSALAAVLLLTAVPAWGQSVDQPAMFLSSNAPVEYPRILAAANIEGEVAIELRVDSTGRLEPGSLRVLTPDVHDLWVNAVTSTVEIWRWTPAVRAGKRVPEVKQYRFTFRIARDDASCPPSTIEHQIICHRDPPMHSAYGLFRGYHTTGFEARGFVPCADSFPSLPPELLRFRQGAHVQANITPDAARALPPDWYRVARHDGPTITYFLVGRGTLRGPTGYRYMGVGEFVVVFDTVFSVHPPVPDACERFRTY